MDDDRMATVAATLDQMPILVTITQGDDQRVVWMNAAGRTMVGERDLDTPLTAWADLLGQRLIEEYEWVWRTGRPCTGAEWRLEFADADGEPGDHWVNFTLAPILWPDGRIRAVVGFGQDVTETVRMREHHEELQRRYLGARDPVAQFQDAFLPKGLPVPQRVELAARYLLAEDETGAGGDWFDAIPLPDGRVVVVVGDVVGHGIDAAVVMGELKVLFEERVRRDGDLVAALGLIEARARRTRGARSATICACVLDPASGELTYCTAGHPPPILVRAGGEAEYLPTTGAGPLFSGLPVVTATLDLAAGDLLVLYSDGIVERPGRTPAQGTVDLLQVVQDVGLGVGPVTLAAVEPVVERVCRRTLEMLTQVTGYADDITLLAAQVVPPVEPLELRLAATPDAARTARADLQDWLEGLRVSAIDAMAVLHAATELVTNAVVHAYPTVSVDNTVALTASLTLDGVLELTVRDEGRWQEPTDDGERGGRGLALVRGFVDDLHVSHDEPGTRALIRHRPVRPASMLRAAPARVPPDRAQDFAVTVVGSTLTLRGVVDHEAAVRLERALGRASRGGVRAVEVDLAQVSHLTSAGVQVLAAARATGDVRLVAPAGSPAQHVLELVHLPYDGGR